MNKSKTLCIAEWQAFGADDIAKVLKGVNLAENSQKIATFRHSEGAHSATEESTNDKEHLNLQMDSSHSLRSAQNDEAMNSADKISQKAQKIFTEFENFAKESGDFDDRTGNHIFLTPCRKNGKNMLKARNFVGLVQTKSGFCLEILPKTFRAKDENEGFKNNQEKITKAKEVLLKMLKTLRDSPFKQSHISNLASKNLPLLEVFALMFLSELERLIKRGLKSDYIGRERNRRFLKGRLLFAQNLRQNLAHKERFFTAADEYTADNAPNRLIKSTLLLLAAQGFSAKTSGRILQARFVFDEISPSKNIDKDFAQSVNFRRFKDYELLLLWCAVFLRRKNFLPYQGSQSAFALLFDMNELFESFVARCLRKSLGGKCVVKAQEKAKFLAQKDGQNMFQIKPDIAIYKKSDKNSPLIIADTKWKILSDNESKNYEISQADLYQMFAYLAKYQCCRGVLIYPKIDDFSRASETDFPKKFKLPRRRKFTFKPQICFYEGKICGENSAQNANLPQENEANPAKNLELGENLPQTQTSKANSTQNLPKIQAPKALTLKICFFSLNKKVK